MFPVASFGRTPTGDGNQPASRLFTTASPSHLTARLKAPGAVTDFHRHSAVSAGKIPQQAEPKLQLFFVCLFFPSGSTNTKAAKVLGGGETHQKCRDLARRQTYGGIGSGWSISTGISRSFHSANGRSGSPRAIKTSKNGESCAFTARPRRPTVFLNFF